MGISSSPLVHNGLVIVHAGGKDNKGVLACDAKTGQPRWSVASGNHSYSSPQLASFDGIEGILMETNLGLRIHGVSGVTNAIMALLGVSVGGNAGVENGADDGCQLPFKGCDPISGLHHHMNCTCRWWTVP